MHPSSHPHHQQPHGAPPRRLGRREPREGGLDILRLDAALHQLLLGRVQGLGCAAGSWWQLWGVGLGIWGIGVFSSGNDRR